MAQVHGAIFVLDASNQSRFDEAQMCFREATSHPFLSAKPILILANKMDQDKLFDLKALVEWVEASASKLDNHQVTVCSAKQAAHRLPKSQILTIRQGKEGRGGSKTLIFIFFFSLSLSIYIRSLCIINFQSRGALALSKCS